MKTTCFRLPLLPLLAALLLPPEGAAAAPAYKAAVLKRWEWGTGAEQVGHRRDLESNPEGPHAFDVDHAGRVWLLDQVNGRVLVMEDGRTRVLPLPVEAHTSFDIAVGDAGGVVLMDPVVKRALLFVDGAGKLRSEVKLAGRFIPAEETGLATGLFRREDGYWVEMRHDLLVHVADAEGAAVRQRVAVRGRPGIDGRTLWEARKLDDRNVEVGRRPAQGSTKREADGFAKVKFGTRIDSLVELSADARGTTWVGAHLLEEGPAPTLRPVREEVQLVALGEGGAEQGRVSVPAASSPEELFRSTRLGGDGALYHLQIAKNGATLWKVAR